MMNSFEDGCLSRLRGCWWFDLESIKLRGEEGRGQTDDGKELKLEQKLHQALKKLK